MSPGLPVCFSGNGAEARGATLRGLLSQRLGPAADPEAGQEVTRTLLPLLGSQLAPLLAGSCHRGHPGP